MPLIARVPRPPRRPFDASGQSLVEFVLVVPMLLVLLLLVADFGRYFAAGITVDSSARDAAEIVAQAYVQDPPAPTPPAPTPGDPAYYDPLHAKAAATVCAEVGSLPNAGSPGTCEDVPVQVCVHDGADPSCATLAGGTSVPAQCDSMSTPPSNTQTDTTETSRYVEVRVCYRFSTLLDIPSIAGIPLPWGDMYIQRDRVFTIADY